MKLSKVVLHRNAAMQKHIVIARNFLLALLVVTASNLFASSSMAQAHDHSAMPAADSADAEPHAGHAAPEDAHAQHAEPVSSDDHSQHATTADPHGGHVMDSNDHAGHATQTDAHAQHADHATQADPHAQHTQTTANDDHSQHTTAVDPHAGHVMGTDEHAGHEAPAAHNHDDMMAEMNMSGGGSIQSIRRDPHAYSNGFEVGEGPYALDNYRLHLMDEMSFGGFRMNRMEQLFLDGADATEYDAQVWYGTSYDRLVLKAEGEVQNSSLEESNTELLWTHAVHSFWNSQIGVLNQTGDGPDRNWLALGIQGTAPYWFEVDATVYLGESGRSAFNLEAEYDLWLTQRLILQPRVEMNVYGQNDQATAIGSGLSDLSAGIRLQYQINRQLVPYAGVEQVRQFGQTAKYSGVSSGDSETRWLAGLRFWF